MTQELTDILAGINMNNDHGLIRIVCIDYLQRHQETCDLDSFLELKRLSSGYDTADSHTTDKWKVEWENTQTPKTVPPPESYQGSYRDYCTMRMH